MKKVRKLLYLALTLAILVFASPVSQVAVFAEEATMEETVEGMPEGAPEDMAAPADDSEAAPGTEDFPEGNMRAEDLIGMMEKPEADKKEIDTESTGSTGTSIYVVLALIAAIAFPIIILALILVAHLRGKKGKKGVVAWSATAAALLLLVGTASNYFMLVKYPLVMNKTFGKGKVTITKEEGSENWDSEYYKKEYATREEAISAAEDFTQREEAEGAVLLKNENNALPLNGAGTKVTLFGVNTVDVAAGSQGEGSNGQKGPTHSIQEGLERAGFVVNPTTIELYDSIYQSDDYKYETKLTKTTDESAAISSVYKYGRNTAGFSGSEPWIIGEAETSLFTDDIEASYGDYSDAAIITLTRVGGEGSDPSQDMGQYTEYGGEKGKHYLELDSTEQELIRYAKAHFDKVVVLLNTMSTMELGDLNEAKTADNLGVDAILWIGGVGSTGTYAIGDILAGNVSPSGHTADIYPADFTKDPTWDNFGVYQYTNVDDSNSPDGHAYLVEYEEGIYMGYRYYETAAAEAEAGNYNGFNYDDAVVYPFGYGLSYTTFDMNYKDTPSFENNTFTFNVEVTNTGSVAGKQVAEIYAEAPYTYGGIEKSKVVLVGFAKTKELAPGESEVVTITVDRDDLASYDSKNEKCYVLDEGTYKFYLSENSHSWASIDSEDTGKYFETSLDKVVFSGENHRSSDEITAVNQFDDITNYHFVDYTDEKSDHGYAHLMTRQDFAGSFPTAPTADDLIAGDDVIIGINYDVKADTREDVEMPTTGADNGLQLVNLRGVDYDDPMWDDLLDQLTVMDMHSLCAYGHFETAEVESVGAPYTSDIDSPTGWINFFKPDLVSNGYTIGTVLASTWNIDLAREYGESIGEEGLQNGLTGWYGPGLDTHRSAFGGRNSEYFSEDGLLAGMITAYVCSGAQSKGIMTYAKHFALNDQESMRNQILCTWADEQAIREIYLKPFEVYAKKAVADVTVLDDEGNTSVVQMQGIGSVMTAYNMVGPIYAGGCEALCHTILRDEWGLDGSAITDAIGVSYAYANPDQTLRRGSDLLLAYDLGMEDTESADSIAELRESSHHILYSKANSNAMNGIAPGTTISYGTPAWKIALVIFDIVSLVLLVLAIVEIRRTKKSQTNV